MAEQLTIATSTLPDVFVDAFRALEQEHGCKPVTLACGEHLVDAFGQHWIELHADGERFGLMGRSDLEAAACDLFHQIHGRPLVVATRSAR